VTLEAALLSVWRQALVENANLVEIEERRYAVRRTARRRLRQVDFEFAGQALRGIEQNPQTRSSWARLAAAGAKVMQFTVAGRYLANVADGKITMYGETAAARLPPPRREESPS
jgi:uncharacterized membrane protein